MATKCRLQYVPNRILDFLLGFSQIEQIFHHLFWTPVYNPTHLYVVIFMLETFIFKYLVHCFWFFILQT